jgi:hypothetical protein
MNHHVVSTNYEELLKGHYLATRTKLLGRPAPKPKAVRITPPPPPAKVEPLPLPPVEPVIFSQDAVRNKDARLPLPTWRRILIEVSRERGVGINDILGHGRTEEVSRVRHEVFWRLRQTGMSYPQIAFRIGNRDHTTALYGVQKHVERMAAERR